MGIVENYRILLDKIGTKVTLVAVSKTRPLSQIVELYEVGQRDFGENRAQELVSKAGAAPADIRWHLIGHLQTNKVKFIAPFVEMIHSVDSLKLLAEINQQALKNERVIKCLLQFHIATEETKFGLSYDETVELITSAAFKSMRNVSICGVMGMATFTDNDDIVSSEFRQLREYFDRLKSDYFQANPEFSEISMGMSGDYQIALAEGSTMLRIGSLIFGER
ncbi:MAG TPA: YggS family pyridoxal phosphate-dependent enzyme [Bacteroidales bacterium]|nr:YggS family pyridoxal phosphate-dependent enzyme [Bacteroidales bacterium]